MQFFKKLIDAFTLGSDRPVKRLIGYYVVLAAVVVALAYSFPTVDRMFGGTERVDLVQVPQVLQDGLRTAPAARVEPAAIPERLTLAISTAILILSTLALMLPVSWVYMSTQKSKGHNQQLAQTLIFLALLFGAMYFLMIRPQQKRRKQFMDLIKSLEVGNEVETIAGIFGTIRRLDDDHAWVEVAEGTVLKMTRAAIRRTVTVDEGSDASE